MPQTEFALGRSEAGQISSLTIIAVTRLAIGLIIAALIAIALTNPSGAQMSRGVTENTPSSAEQQDTNAELFVRCLQDWDIGTHMTKKEWSGACQRLLIERGNDPFPNSGNNFARTDK